MPVGERGWWHLFSLLFLSHCSRFLSQHTHKNKNVGMWFSIGRMDGAGGNFFFLFLWTSMGFGVLWRDRQITSRTVANMESWKSNLVDPAFVSSFEINVPQREWKTTKRYIYAVRCNRIRASHLEFGLFQKPKKGTTFSSCCCVLQSGFREFVFLSPIFYLAVTTMLRVVSGRVRLDYYLY